MNPKVETALTHRRFTCSKLFFSSSHTEVIQSIRLLFGRSIHYVRVVLLLSSNSVEPCLFD